MPSARRQITISIVAISGLLLAGLGTLSVLRNRVSVDSAALLKRLPTQDAVVAGLDFEALRKGRYLDWLGSAKDHEDPEYKAFVRDSGFDYERDLGKALISFSPDGTFFLVKGHFDWPRIENYVLRQKGSCYQHLCRLQGSKPERHISFFPLRSDLMAMAVAPDDTAATRLQNLGPQADIEIPSQPVWISFSSGALRHSASLPGSSPLFASAIKDASRVSLTLGPSANGFDLRLDAACRDAREAGALTQQLKSLTSMLEHAARGVNGNPENGPNSNGLGALLLLGTFDQAGTHVLGRWPVRRSLLENLAGGV